MVIIQLKIGWNCVSDILDHRQMRQLADHEDEKRRAEDNPMPTPWEEIE